MAILSKITATPIAHNHNGQSQEQGKHVEASGRVAKTSEPVEKPKKNKRKARGAARGANPRVSESHAQPGAAVANAPPGPGIADEIMGESKVRQRRMRSICNVEAEEYVRVCFDRVTTSSTLAWSRQPQDIKAAHADMLREAAALRNAVK